MQGRILFEGTIVQRPQEGIAEDPIVLPVSGDALFVGGSHQLIVRVGREDDGKDEPVPRVLGRPHGTVYGTGPLIEGYLLYGHVGRVPVAGVPHPLHVQVPVRVVHVDDDQVSDPHHPAQVYDQRDGVPRIRWQRPAEERILCLVVQFGTRRCPRDLWVPQQPRHDTHGDRHGGPVRPDEGARESLRRIAVPAAGLFDDVPERRTPGELGIGEFRRESHRTPSVQASQFRYDGPIAGVQMMHRQGDGIRILKGHAKGSMISRRER